MKCVKTFEEVYALEFCLRKQCCAIFLQQPSFLLERPYGAERLKIVNGITALYIELLNVRLYSMLTDNRPGYLLT